MDWFARVYALYMKEERVSRSRTINDITFSFVFFEMLSRYTHNLSNAGANFAVLINVFKTEAKI